MCEPIAFQGEFAGIGTPSPDVLRVAIGEGLTGWVAQHNRDDPARRRRDADPRGRQIGERPRRGVDAPRPDDLRDRASWA